MPDYEHGDTTDQFLINLHQDWKICNKLFGSGQEMIWAIEKEMEIRGLQAQPYGWTTPREYESKNLK